jgi:hypothetical protein
MIWVRILKKKKNKENEEMIAMAERRRTEGDGGKEQDV